MLGYDGTGIRILSTLKIKYRTYYDLIYECLKYCVAYESSKSRPNTKSRFVDILGGNSKVFKKYFDELINKYQLMEENKDVKYHTQIYRITDKGREYITHFERLRGLLDV